MDEPPPDNVVSLDAERVLRRPQPPAAEGYARKPIPAGQWGSNDNPQATIVHSGGVTFTKVKTSWGWLRW